MVHQTPSLQQLFCSMVSGNQGAITPSFITKCSGNSFFAKSQ